MVYNNPELPHRQLQETPERAEAPLQPPKKFSFPLNADSWNADGASTHTMQIYSTFRKGPFETTFDALWESTGTGFAETFKELIQASPKGVVNEVSEELGEITTDQGILDYITASTQDNLRGIYERLQRALNASADRNLRSERFKRINNDSKRLKNIFTFHMPTPLIYPVQNEYEQVKLTETIGGSLGAFISNAMFVNSTLRQAVGDAGSAASSLSAYAGYPINPKVEIVFRNIAQRRFEFNFSFYPASESETAMLKEMLTMLRHDASPELLNFSGLFWGAPNTFDIMLLHNGRENKQVPRISQCVCEEIEINYTPTNTGWTTFMNGHPVSTSMRIAFRELEPIDRANVLRGF